MTGVKHQGNEFVIKLRVLRQRGGNISWHTRIFTYGRSQIAEQQQLLTP
jgi:hypothetical protein